MKHDFILSGIPQKEVQHLFHLDEQTLNAKGISKIIVDEKPGFPCWLSLKDAEIGETILAFNYEHHKVSSPYRSSGPVFVRIHAKEAQLKQNEIPKMLKYRYLSLRAYNAEGIMVDATTLFGDQLKNEIQTIFSNHEVAYIQVHNAKPGCYNCQINRV